MRKRLSVEERLERKIKRTETCWLWQGRSELYDDYGAIAVNGKRCPAHRAAYELWVEPIPEGKLVLHHCDVKRCVRPDHLFLGTHKDNTQDHMRKYGGLWSKRYALEHGLGEVGRRYVEEKRKMSQ